MGVFQVDVPLFVPLFVPFLLNMLFTAALLSARRLSMFAVISCAPVDVLMFRMRPLEKDA